MNDAKNSLNYRNILLRELDTRKNKNPSYNLSSFARFLKIPPSRLSEILRGKVGLSIAKAVTITNILKLSERETSLFLDLVRVDHARNPREKEEAKLRLNRHTEEFNLYADEEFSSIADWYHHALIELINLTPGKTKLEMSQSLGVDMFTLDSGIKRLLKLEIITKDQKGYKLTHNSRTTSTDVPSEAIKKLNEQILTKASKELRKQDVDNRDYSIIFLSFNKSQMNLAKQRIKDFRRSFMKEFENSLDKDSVYCMGVQLFEMTGNESRK